MATYAEDTKLEAVSLTPSDKKLTEGSCGSQPSTAINGSEYGFNKILCWLEFVDSNIDKSSNDIMYLGAYSEIAPRDSEHIVQASNIYHLLRGKCINDSQTLARFMYALKKLGRKRRGIYCNNQFSKKVKVLPPSTHDYDDRATENHEFGFYQCLVDLCVTLEEDRSVSKRVRMYVSRYILGIYPESTVAKLFLKMLRKPDILSKDNQEQLSLALGQCGADSCQVILQHFRLQFKKHEIEWENVTPYLKVEGISPVSSLLTVNSAGSSSLTGDRHHTSSPSLLSNGSRGSSPRSIIGDRQLSGFRQHHVTHTTIDEETSLLEGNPDENGHLPAAAHNTTITPPQVNRYPWKCCLVAIVLQGLTTLLLAVGISLIVLASTSGSSVNQNRMAVYKNTTAALGEVQWFTTQNVTLYQDPGNGEVHIPLKFYRSDENCNSLHSIPSKNDNERNKSISLHQPQVVLFRDYLLHGSELSYNVCAVTNEKNATKFHVDFYIVDNLDENLSFNPDTSHYLFHDDVNLTYNHDLKQTSVCFNDIIHTLPKRGYYSVIILLPSEVPYSNLSLWYYQNNSLNIINTSELHPMCEHSAAIYSPKDPCIVNSTTHFISAFCIVVEVEYSNYDPFTHIYI